ncbi:MAG: ferritin family protein [Desulfobacterales bacterium]|nr:ferritin family protein [Desulfobacterales bacterium]
MNARERLNALDVALDNETREREFYLKNASRTKNPLGKAMFQQIADEELEHHQRLKELRERWESKEKWPETVPLKVKDTIVMDILKESVQKADKMPERDDDDLKAIQTAIDFEAKGASHYAKLRDEVSDPKEKEFFGLLANIEHEHYLSLKDTEEYLTDPSSWYVKTEHHGLNGA